MDRPGFKEFLVTLLKRGRVNDEHIDIFLSPENLVKFDLAFIHKTFDPVDNYEMMEFLGDGTVNEFIPYYIKIRFPRIVSVKWLTKIKHNMVSKKQLARLAKVQGLEKFIRYGKKMEEEMAKNRDLDNNIEYLSMLEDVMEAFFGCLTLVIENSGRDHGVAVQVSANILKSFFDNEEISIKYTDVFDAVSRLKELYESKERGFKWPTGEIDESKKRGFKQPIGEQAYEITRPHGDQFKVTVYGWPLNDKKPVLANRVVLATAFDIEKQNAKQKAAKQALAILDSSHGIRELPSNPYEK